MEEQMVITTIVFKRLWGFFTDKVQNDALREKLTTKAAVLNPVLPVDWAARQPHQR